MIFTKSMTNEEQKLLYDFHDIFQHINLGGLNQLSESGKWFRY